MLASNPRRITLTLLCYITLVLTLASVSQANSVTPEKRDHVVLNRMLKKRAFDISDTIGSAGKRQIDLGAIGAGAAPPTFPSGSSTSLSASSTGVASVTSASASVTSAAGSSDTTSLPTTSAQDTASQLSSPSGTPSDLSTSSVPSSTSSLPSTSSTPTDVATPTSAPPTSTPGTHQTTSYNKSLGLVTATVTDDAASTAAPVSGASTSSTSKTTKTTLIVIVAIAASIGGVAVLWTIIRKWKFKPSADFEDRMQPIDWQPSGLDDHEAVPGLHRSGTAVSHGSFHSAGHENSYGGHGSESGHGSNTLQPLPDHDFTAGPTTLAPGGGYADLTRGPSPQPQMDQLARGPSVTRPNYDYGVPLHHQGGYEFTGSGGRY